MPIKAVNDDNMRIGVCDDDNDNDDCDDDIDGDGLGAYQVCESDGDDDEDAVDGDDDYSGKLEEACLNCVVDAIVIKDPDHILNKKKTFRIFKTSFVFRCASSIFCFYYGVSFLQMTENLLIKEY